MIVYKNLQVQDHSHEALKRCCTRIIFNHILNCSCSCSCARAWNNFWRSVEKNFELACIVFIFLNVTSFRIIRTACYIYIWIPIWYIVVIQINLLIENFFILYLMIWFGDIFCVTSHIMLTSSIIMSTYNWSTSQSWFLWIIKLE